MSHDATSKQQRQASELKLYGSCRHTKKKKKKKMPQVSMGTAAVCHPAPWISGSTGTCRWHFCVSDDVCAPLPFSTSALCSDDTEKKQDVKSGVCMPSKSKYKQFHVHKQTTTVNTCDRRLRNVTPSSQEYTTNTKKKNLPFSGAGESVNDAHVHDDQDHTTQQLAGWDGTQPAECCRLSPCSYRATFLKQANNIKVHKHTLFPHKKPFTF